MAKFVSVSGGMSLIQVDTEAELSNPDTSASFTVAAPIPLQGKIAVGSAKCGCLALFQLSLDYEHALVTETSSKDINSESFQPIYTEDGLYYIIVQGSYMAEPIYITELDPATVNNIVANKDTAQIILSLNTGTGYQSLRLTFTQLIDVIKTAITTGVLNIVVSGVSGTEATLISTNIIDAELNGQNLDILASIPVSGEQGLYVNTLTGAYEIYNIGTDLSGAKLKIIYSKG